MTTVPFSMTGPETAGHGRHDGEGAPRRGPAA